jgi:hypothetical protein
MENSGGGPDLGGAESVLTEWQERATVALFAYNDAANRCRTWNTFLGSIAAVLAAAIGTTVFVTLQHELNLAARITVGAVSVLTAVVSGVLASASLPHRIGDYEKAARRYGRLRRELEENRWLLAAGGLQNVTRVVALLREALDQAAEDSPNAPQRIWDRARRRVKEKSGSEGDGSADGGTGVTDQTISR